MTTRSSAASSSGMCASSQPAPLWSRLPGLLPTSCRARASTSLISPSRLISSTCCSFSWAASSSLTSASRGTGTGRCSAIRAWRHTASVSRRSRRRCSTPTTGAARLLGRRSGLSWRPPISGRSPKAASTGWTTVCCFGRTSHTLFDRGYLGVDPGYRLRVSPRLRQDFGNGERFYAQAGQVVALPERRAERPQREFLEWHLDEKFMAS